MANISRRRTGELTRALFHILKTQPEGMRASDALASQKKQVVLTEYESGDYIPRSDAEFPEASSSDLKVHELEKAIYDQNEFMQA